MPSVLALNLVSPTILTLNLVDDASTVLNAVGGPTIEWEIAGLGGPPGQSATIDVGITTTGDPGTDALVINSGDKTTAVFDFTIPRGESGTMEVGTVTTGEAGTDAIIVNVGTPGQAVLDFTIPKGDKGDSGGFYRHSQGAPADQWVVVHNLGYRPAVSAEDSAGTLVEGDVTHLDDNSLTITFTVPFGGYANLS